MDEWITQWSTPDEQPAAKKPPARKAAAKKSTARKAPAKKTPAKKTPAKKVARTTPPTLPDSEAIGANPTRRYGSAGSRSLAR